MSGSSIVHILSVSPDHADHQAVANIFRNPAWVLLEADSARSARSILCDRQVDVVLSERDLLPGSWRDVLEWSLFLGKAPPLIVASRLADEELWREALRLGAFDVVAKPFDRAEVIRSVRMAWMSRLSGAQSYPAYKVLRAAG